MAIIRNKQTLLSHGNIAGRKMVLDILETGLAAGDPFPNVLECLRIEGNKLIVGGERFAWATVTGSSVLDRPRPWPDEPLVFDLDHVRNIYLVGGGKAAQRMAEGIEAVLGDRIVEGQVNAKKGDTIRLKHANVTLAGHPIPDKDSVAGARRIIEIEHKAGEHDIVFMTQSGGGTALMACPAPGLTLADLQAVDRILYFEHGAPIVAANQVRGLLSVVRQKHSRHVQDATFIQLSTFERSPAIRARGRVTAQFGRTDAEQAIHLLHEYNCWDEMPESVRAHLLRGDPAHDLLRAEEWWDKPHFNICVMHPGYMLDAAQDRARKLGLDARILVSSLNGQEASAVGETMGMIAREIAQRDQPLAPPTVLLVGGELAVTTGKGAGLGGRNQEFALAAAKTIAGLDNVVIASADSDGRDGPSDLAGAIVDGKTMTRARELGIDVEDVLRHHDSDPTFHTLGDGIDTGVQPTNVQDLRVIYVSTPTQQESHLRP